MDPITKDFVAGIHRFIKTEGVDLVHFVEGQRKDDIALGYLAGFGGTEGITFVGRAQERCSVFRTEQRVNPNTKGRYPFIVRASAVVNQFYFYGTDDDFGPFFFKFGTYFPYTAKACSTCITGLNAKPPRPVSASTPSTTALQAAAISAPCRRSATASAPSM